MKNQKNKKLISLKWKIASYLLIFAAGLIALVFVFQIVLLTPMYEKYKKSTLQQGADEVAEALSEDNEEDLINTMYRVGQENDGCVRIINNGVDVGAGNMGCTLYRLSYSDVNRLAENAASNNNSYLQISSGVFNGSKPSDAPRSDFRSMILTKLVTIGEQTAVIMIYAGLSPVNATTRTLSMQIGYIAAIILIAVAVLVYLMNRHITKPLIRINNAAKSLPEGIYEADTAKAEYSEAAELNETLSQAAKDIQKADKAKRDLISNVSHDLRTPLSLINGYGQMMKDLPGEKTDENLQVIIDESNRLTYLVNDLLDLSRLQDNRIVLNRTDFSLDGLLKREIRKYDVYHVREGFDIELDVQDHLIVNADEKRIEQVFNNFMTNAINYSGNSKKINVRAYKADEDNAKVEVQDFGEGIAEDQIDDIWDRYYKIDKEHVRSFNSSGIGLAIVRQLLELHHVRYGVQSKLNEGSTFWFMLPLAKDQAGKEE